MWRMATAFSSPASTWLWTGSMSALSSRHAAGALQRDDHGASCRQPVVLCWRHQEADVWLGPLCDGCRILAGYNRESLPARGQGLQPLQAAQLKAQLPWMPAASACQTGGPTWRADSCRSRQLVWMGMPTKAHWLQRCTCWSVSSRSSPRQRTRSQAGPCWSLDIRWEVSACTQLRCERYWHTTSC